MEVVVKRMNVPLKGKKPEDESSLGEKTEGHNLIQKESAADYVVSTMETEMPSFWDPED
jgi:hypothetical protein